MSESSLKNILLGVLDDFLARAAGPTASDKATSTALVATDGSLSSLLAMFIMSTEASCSDVADFVVVLGTRTRLTNFFFFGGEFASCVGSGCASTRAPIDDCSIGFTGCFLATFCCLVVLAFGLLSMCSFSRSSMAVVVCVLSFMLGLLVSTLSCTCFRTAFFSGTAFFRLFSTMHSSRGFWLGVVFLGGAGSVTEMVCIE